MDVYVCSLNRATIEAIWSTLSLELFYLTNDDEERYSIQAHPIILSQFLQASKMAINWIYLLLQGISPYKQLTLHLVIQYFHPNSQS